METKISVQWYDPQGMGFWLRGIKADGSFYGELEYAYGDPARRAGTTIDGKIPDDDWATCKGLIAKCSSPSPTQSKHWTGQIASWSNSIATPTILFQFEPGDEGQSTGARAFLELKTILEKHLAAQAAGLIASSKKTHNQQIHPIAGKPGSG